MNKSPLAFTSKFIAAALVQLLAQTAAAQLWVSSDFNHEVLQYDPPSGAVLPGQPLIPAARGGLDQPHGILDRRSGVLVASFGTHEVKRYHRTTGTFIDNFIPLTAGLNAPVYLAIGPSDGFLYISSQGNDRLLRFNLETGEAIDGAPFISGGSLDGPSGFGWSPDRSILYVAGRYSANVLAFNATSGTPLNSGHIFAGGLGVGSTFGLAVDTASGDVFVATSGNVRRYSPAGTLLTTIITPGAIGLERSPDGNSIYVAANNNLYRIAMANNTVTGPLLVGPTINVLNFFHFSRVTEPQVGPMTSKMVEVAPGQLRFEFAFPVLGLTSGSTAILQSSTDLIDWADGVTYTVTGETVLRDGSTSTLQVGFAGAGGSFSVTEREGNSPTEGARRYYRISARGR